MPKGHPINTHLRQRIIEEISSEFMNNWKHLNRKDRISEVMKMSGLDKLAATSAYDEAEESYEQATGIEVARPGRRKRKKT